MKEALRRYHNVYEYCDKNSKNLPPGLIEEVCWWCDKSIFDVHLFRCKGCKVGRYCNKECQLNDWGRHEDYCWNEQERRETKDIQFVRYHFYKKPMANPLVILARSWVPEGTKIATMI